jgi:hypothetical protein
VAEQLKRSKSGKVRAVPVPAGSLVATAFAITNYADAYAIDLPDGGAFDVDTLTRLIATSAPRWAEQLMWLRNRIVSVFGLRTPDALVPTLSTAPLQPGDTAGIFEVLARSDDEILFGGDDRHLDFRGSMLLQRDAARCQAILSTVVHYNNWTGRVYFFFIRPFHRLIVSSLLRNLGRRLSTDA